MRKVHFWSQNSSTDLGQYSRNWKFIKSFYIERCLFYVKPYIYTRTLTGSVSDSEYGSGARLLWMQKWSPKCGMNIQ